MSTQNKKFNSSGGELVAIWMITYNHERFISQAIESVLNQKTDFRYRLFIGEDCSTDNTRHICMEYEKHYPNKITLILNQRNDLRQNGLNTYFACFNSGCKYIAQLEGDDFWIDPYKLKKQVDVLERYSEFAMCFTNSYIVDGNNHIIKNSRLENDRKRNLTQADIISGLVPPTNTIMIRNTIRKHFIQFPDIVNGDILISALATENGDAKYIDEITASYRIHDKSLWSSNSSEYQIKNYIKTYLSLLVRFKHKYEDILLKALYHGYEELLENYKKKRIGSC